jgi:hypothetical protein
MSRLKRDIRRGIRDRMTGVAWVFVASPLLVLAFGRGRYSVIEAMFMPVVGIAMLLWFRTRPTVPAHVASVELVQPGGDYTGPDALTEPFYLAWCDCGWNGDDQNDERSARAEALEHTQHVRDGLHAWGG